MTSRTRPGRGRWVLLFLLMGLPALFSAMALPLSPANALPWAAVSWPIAGVAGYKIWRIDHPGDSARFAVGIRVRALLRYGFLILLGLLPLILVGGVVLWLLAISALFLILAIGTWIERVRAARSSTAAAIDQRTIPDAAEPADVELAAALAEESRS